MQRLIAVLLFLPIASLAGPPPDFTAGNLLFKQREQPEKAREALDAYRSLYEAFPDNAEAAWRFAMAAQFVGYRLTKESEERKELYREGRDAAKRAAERHPDCAPCHFWAGIQMALYGDEIGAVKMLFTLATIRKHLLQSAKLDETYACAGAYRVLGLIEQKLPGILGGSDDKAREYFEKAVAALPACPLNYLFLSRLHAEVFHDKKAAEAVAEKGRSYPPPPQDEIEAREAYEELRPFLRVALNL